MVTELKVWSYDNSVNRVSNQTMHPAYLYQWTCHNGKYFKGGLSWKICILCWTDAYFCVIDVQPAHKVVFVVKS